MREYDRPLPEINTTLKPFWDGAKKHELMAYKCQNCGTHYFPVTHCMVCNSPKMEWVKVSGKGKIYTFIVYDTAFNPHWEKYVPYNVAWIELDGGPIMMSNIIDCPNEEIYIDMPVQAAFRDVTDEITLPMFKPVGLEGAGRLPPF